MKKNAIITFLLAFVVIFQTSAQQKYAIIITGDSPGDGYQGQFENPNSDYDEFWNDTYLMWELLVTKFGFDHEKVIVLYGNGNDYSFSGISSRYTYINSGIPGISKITDYSATIANVRTIFNDLRYGTTDNDFLFLFTFGHGHTIPAEQPCNGYLELVGEDIIDTELGDLLNNVPASKRVIWMQNCAGGDFAEELSGNSNYFVAATQPVQVGGYAMPADDCFKDAQGVTQCGIPFLENEIISGRVYTHGEFIFHEYSSANGSTPDGDTYYVISPEGDFSNVDINQDNYLTFSELFNYVDINDTQGTDDPFAVDLGIIGDYTSFEYPTLLHDQIYQNMTCRGLVGISNNTTITSGYTLEIADNATVYFLNGSNLIINSGATLSIGNNVHFIKDVPSATGVIEINGTMSACNNCVFDGGEGQVNRMEIRLKKPNGSFSFNNCQFINCKVIGTACDMTFNECALFRANVEVPNIFSTDKLLDIQHCQFDGDGINVPAISFSSTRKFLISHNSIHHYNSSGIDISNNSGGGLIYLISGNTISDCSTGININASRASVRTNQIFHNEKGVQNYNNNAVSIWGDCRAARVQDTQQIYDNSDVEFVSTKSFPASFSYNAITDGVHPEAVRVKCIDCPAGTFTIERNYWGSNPNMNQILSPNNIFDYTPSWAPGQGCPGGGTAGTSLGEADSMYKAAVEFLENGDYSAAKNTFNSTVQQYPETEYAISSMNELFFLEDQTDQDFENLKSFYETDSIVNSDSILSISADVLANRCEIKLGNYTTAINWFEEVIDNPLCNSDSIFAIIDLGYTYLMLSEDSLKSSVVGRKPQFKPKSYPSFMTYRNYLLSLIDGSEQMNNNKILNKKIGRIKSVFPNPAKDLSTIQFELHETAIVQFVLFNSIGQEILSGIQSNFEKGLHEITISLDAVHEGVYILQMIADHKIQDGTKLSLTK